MNKTIIYITMMIVFSAIALADTTVYQGRIENATNGTAMQGTFAINLTLYNHTADTQLYSSVQSLSTNNNGVFNMILNSIDPAYLQNSVYFKLKIDGVESSRSNVTSSLKSMYCSLANDTTYLNGQPASYYLGTYSDGWINSTTNTSIIDKVTKANTSMKSYADARDVVFNNSIVSYVLYVNSTNGVGSTSYSDGWINSTTNISIIDKVTTANNSMKSYADARDVVFNNSMASYVLYVNASNGVGSGSYSDDWINTTTNVSIIDKVTTANTSMKSYVDSRDVVFNNSLKSYIDTQDNAQDSCSEISGCVVGAVTDGNTGWDNSYGLFSSIENFTGTLTGGNICIYDSDNSQINCTYTDQVGGDAYSDAWINITTNASIIDKVIIANTSMKGYVDSRDVVFNNSMASYVLYVNSSNGVGSGTYSDGWINSTTNASIIEKVTIANTSMQSYVDARDVVFNNSLKSYIDTQDNAQDECSEISGCVVGAITDGNTGWDNSYGLLNNIDNITGSLIGDRICIYDSNIDKINCTYTDQVGGDAYSDAWINITTNISIIEKVTTANISMKGYVDSRDVVFNNSMASYVLYVNSTNGVGSGSYSDGWINTTTNASIIDKVTTANTSMKTYVDSRDVTFNSSLKSYVDTQDSAQDSCSEITDCVVGAITDGNTGWDNSYGLLSNIDNITGTLIGDKICIYDSNLDKINCTYTDSDSIYSDAWINTTTNMSIINKVTTANNSMKLYVDSRDVTFNTSLKSYVDTQDNAQDECSEISGCVVGAITTYENLTANDIIRFGFINNSNTTEWDKDASNDLSLAGVLLDGFIRLTNITQVFISEIGFYNITQINDNNATVVAYVNSRDVAFNDSIKIYADARDVTFNTSIKLYADARDVVFNNSIKSYVDTQDSAQDECSEISGCVVGAITSAPVYTNSSFDLSKIPTTGNVSHTGENGSCYGNTCQGRIFYNGTGLVIRLG